MDSGRSRDIPEIGIGMLGYAFMGKAHSNGFLQMPYLFWPPPAYPRLLMIAGRSEEAVREAASRYGWESYTTDWHDIIEDDRIRIFDNGGIVVGSYAQLVCFFVVLFCLCIRV